MDSIPILVSQLEQDPDTMGIFVPDADVLLERIPVETLQENLGKLCQQVGTVVSHARQVGDFKLKEVTVQVEITAEGGVEMIGTAKVGGKGAITLTFAE